MELADNNQKQTMNTTEAILTRRSIRKYVNKPIPDKLIHKLLEAAMYAPSARNYRPWHFITVRQRRMLDKLSEVHPYAGMLKEAGVAILVCGDLSQEKEEGYLAVNCAAAIQNILLSAHEHALGSCWLGVFPRRQRMNDISELLELPGHIVPIGLIAVGYPAEQKPVPRRFEPEKIHREKW